MGFLGGGWLDLVCCGVEGGRGLGSNPCKAGLLH
jgi:hypothetical protein